MTHTREDQAEGVEVREATQEEGWALLDNQARQRLGMTGEEFIRQWDAGELMNGHERPEVTSIAMLLPFVRATHETNGR